MNPLDFLATGYAGPGPAPQSDQLMSPGAASTGIPPEVLELLSRTQTQGALPDIPKTNPRDALTPALFQFAQAVTAPRRKGTSTSNAILGALNQGMGTFTKTRDAQQDRAIQQEMARRKLAESDLNMDQARTAIAGNTQRMIHAAKDQKFQDETRPMEIQRMQMALDKATTDQELANLQLRAAQVKDKYAVQEQEALLEERQARTAQAKAAAAASAAHAGLYKKQTEEFMNAIEARKKTPQGKVIEGSTITGELDRIQIGNNVYRLPVDDVAQATAWATKQVDALVAIGELKKNTPEYRSKLREFYADAKKGNVPALKTSTTPEAPTAPAAPEVPVGGFGPPEGLKKAMEENPTVVYEHPEGSGTYWARGRRLTETEKATKMRKPGAPAKPQDSGEDTNAALLAEENRRTLEKSREFARSTR